MITNTDGGDGGGSGVICIKMSDYDAHLQAIEN